MSACVLKVYVVWCSYVIVIAKFFWTHCIMC